MNITNKALKYIVFQRTSYLSEYKVYRLLGNIGAKFDFLHKPIVTLKSLVYSKAIKQSFQQDMENEYQEIKKFLPAKVENLLDIGSGIGGINVFLSQHYENEIDIHLLDKTATDEVIHYYFENEGSFYNSLDLAKQFLSENSISEDKIHLHDADNPADCFSIKYDLIISLISWGFHYPLATYLNQVKDALAEGGVLILDLRKDSGGLEILQANFQKVEIITDNNKKLKVAAFN
jgi:SAM-dependent methyltransferase